MKDSEYVNRFYAGVSACEEKAIMGMAEQLLAEFNAELHSQRDYSEKRIRGLLWRYNSKGNRIAELMNRRYSWEHEGEGKSLLLVKLDWFRNVVKIGEVKEEKARSRKEEREARRREKEREELRKEMETWE